MIPKWTMAGVLPPVRPNVPGYSVDRSPFKVSLLSIVKYFAFSPERIAILDGLLRYRKELHILGLTAGFQWLDGSFMENVEVLEKRPPKDVDVVTYFYLPEGDSQATFAAKAGNLFNHSFIKSTYLVDAYPQILGEPTSAADVRAISYWYSMWAHRRNGLWKGFLEVDLNPVEDVPATSELARMVSQLSQANNVVEMVGRTT